MSIIQEIEAFLRRSDDAWEVAVSNRMKQFGLTIPGIKILLPIEITNPQLLIDLKNRKIILKRYATIEPELKFVIEEVSEDFTDEVRSNLKL